MSNYAPSITTQPHNSETLDGLPESAFATLIGTAPDRATTLDQAKQLVYVRANWNKNLEANGGKLPYRPIKYFSRDLVGTIMDTYRNRAGTGVIKHITGATVATAQATDAYTQIQSAILTRYPSANIDVVRTIMRTWYYATVDGVIASSLILPGVQRFPTEGAAQMLALDERHRALDEAKQELGKETFFGRIGSAVTSLFAAPGELASAATTTAKVAGVGVVVVGLGVVATVVWSVTGKIRQLDANEAMREQHKTIRQIGPDVASAVIRKGR